MSSTTCTYMYVKGYSVSTLTNYSLYMQVSFREKGEGGRGRGAEGQENRFVPLKSNRPSSYTATRVFVHMLPPPPKISIMCGSPPVKFSELNPDVCSQ